MKLYRHFFLFAFLLLPIAIFCSDLSDVAIFTGDLKSMAGPQEEIRLIKNFPQAFYKICYVPELGFFYIDNRVDIIKNVLRQGKVWENHIVTLLKTHIKPGTTAVDIGAHIGSHTLCMAKYVGKEGKVFAFEPQQKIYSELVMNLLLNGCTNVAAYRCAVGDSSGKIEMSAVTIDNEGGTSIGKGGESAKMIPLDALELENVSCIKIDVENFEYQVLLGAQETIRKNKPVLILEIMGNTYQYTPNRQDRIQKTLYFIQEMGYSLKYIEGSWSDWIAIPL